MSLEVVEFLKQPRSYPHHPESVELRETHISWVFLAGREAYKLKKPVRFDFLDFSSLDLRKAACEAELRLNRRLSPSVYRGLVPVCQSKAGKLSLDGAGEPVDWLVRMRRLDDARTLEAVLSHPDAAANCEPQIRAVAEHLAKFYVSQAPITTRIGEFREQLRHHIADNQHQLLQLDALESAQNTIRLVHAAQMRFLVVHQEVLDDRVRDGRIVDGHGDLRPEHIYLNHEPLVIDCIEFNDEYRINDIADELAFLAMECDRLHVASVGKLLFEAYAEESHDVVPPRLLAFYKAYRACVRAKVAALRGQQLDSNASTPSGERERSLEHIYLELAEQYVGDLESRLVILVGGLMGSGKSTLAAQIGEQLSGEIISSDVVRQQLTQPGTVPQAAEAYGEGKYSTQSRMDTYRAMMSYAADAMAHNNLVILDATFSTHDMRQLAFQFAESHGAKIVQVQCNCPRDVALQRLADRARAGDSASEAKPEHFDLQAADSQEATSAFPLVDVDTTLALARQREAVLDIVRDALA